MDSIKSTLNTENKGYLTLILVLSIVVPLAVAFLLFMPQKFAVSGEWVKFLPHLNGIINSSTAVLLITGYVFIKNKQTELHKKLMLAAFILGCIFLICYVIYHSTAHSVPYGDLNKDFVRDASEKEQAGIMLYIYLLLLISHVILAAIVVPFVLLSVYYGVTKKYVSHKKVTKYSFPLWLYVSVSGVLVYLLIRPYY